MTSLNRVYGYIRVSDKDQNEGRQLEAMQGANVEDIYIFLDKQSGKDFARPQYKMLKNALRNGDLLVIKSIDRLGRNYQEIIREWREITQDIKADVKVLDMPLLDTTINKDLLGTFISDLVLQVLSFVAEQERANIKTRQAEGIALAKANGVNLGRPRANYPDHWQEVYSQWKDGQLTAIKAMQALELKRTTFYKLVNQYEKGL